MADAVIGGITGADFTIEVPFFTTDTPVADMHLAIKGTPGDFDWRIYMPTTNSLRFEVVESDNTTVRYLVVADLSAYMELGDDTTYAYLSIRMDSTSGILDMEITRLNGSEVDRNTVATLETSNSAWKNNVLNVMVLGNSGIDAANPWAGGLDEFAFYNRAVTDSERLELVNWWATNNPDLDYGTIETLQFDDNFGVTGLVNSTRGPNQFRQNYRTSDSTYPGLIGDFAVGVPAPVVAPDVGVDVEGDPTDLETDTRFYLMTYVNRLGFESAPGPVTSSPIYVGPTSNVTIAQPKYSDIAYEASVYDSNRLEDYVGIVEARIYRTNTGTSETGFQFVTRTALYSDLPNSAIGALDDVDNDDLGELLITDNWDVPPPDVTTGCKMANGTYVLAHEFRVHFSVPGVTYAFPILYNRVIKHEALHLEAIGTSALLLTSGGPHLIVGASGDTMEIVELPYSHVPTSVRGVSSYMDLVIFPAQDGLIGIDQNGRVENLTEDLFEEDQWRAEVLLTDVVSEVYDSVYYGFYNANSDTGYRGFSFNLKTKEWNWLDNNIFDTTVLTGMHYDRRSDSLYVADQGTPNLLEWQPHVVTFQGQNSNPFLDTDPIAYWDFDESSGGTYNDTAVNALSNSTANDISNSNLVADITTMTGGVNNAFYAGRQGLTATSGTTEGVVQTQGGVAHDAVGSIFESQSDWTIFLYMTREDVSAYTSGGGYDFGQGDGVIADANIDSFILGRGNEGPNEMRLTYQPSTDELRLFQDTPDGVFNGVLTTQFSTFFPVDTKVCFRLEGDGTTGIVTAYAGTTTIGSVDLSGEFTARSGNIDWRFVDGVALDNSGLMLGRGDTYVSGGNLSWVGKMDEAAYFNRKLTNQEVTDLCAGPSAGLVPAQWQWWTKEFIIPQRSYGCFKVMGELDSSNAVEVTLEVDGVDQPLFNVTPGEAVGICTNEAVYRLPPIRAQRMRLKLRASTGAPVVESIQVAVHPREIV